jgi:hypothetical protein
LNRRSQEIAYHLLPAAFWVLATGGVVLWAVFNPPFRVFHYLPALMAILSGAIVRRVERHSSSVEQCFEVGLLLGIAAYWLPTVLFLILPIWGYLIYRNLFKMRSFVATFVGLAAVAIWIAVLAFFLPESFHFSPFTVHLSLWIPTSAIVFAWLGTTIVRQILRVR